ncbi:MAG TPA: hypothetical protein VGN55_17515 [Xanthobacteraceae bacterium]|jgi:hypothetical protein
MKLCSGILISALGIALAGLLANDAATQGAGRAGPAATARAPHAVWREVQWPFRIDGWGIGRAYRCAPADCGSEINLYLRAKVGFCNCATGVSDDADLDRVSDLELFSEEFVGLIDGRPVDVGRLKGRSRLYRVKIPYAGAHDMWQIGFNDKCDVAVATVLTDPNRLSEAEGLALDFLGSDPVQRWAAAELGGNGI